ncbi:reverse transcriptase domain-containing protein [Tanacetum coccineum]
MPRTSVKGQLLADFIVERPEDDSLVTTMEVEEELLNPWTLFTDGSSCVDGSGAGLILTNPKGTEFTYALRFRCPEVKTKKASALSKIASTRFSHLTKQVLVEELREKSIHEVEVLTVVEEEGNTWMTPIYKYLTEETLPTEKENARALRRKSRRYAVINEVLYKKSYLGPWLRCVRPLQANYVLKEIHEGSCTMHRFASVKHPQANGLVERANRSLREGIKAWLDEKRSKDWIEEIPHVLWVHDEVFLALGWHLEEIHMTWAHLEKKWTRLRTYTKSLEELCIQRVETASQA